MKKYCSIFMLLLFILPVRGVYASQNIDVFVDGNKVIFDTVPVIRYGRVLVPLRAICEKLGASVDWNENSKVITIKKDKITNILTIDNKKAVKDSNGHKKEITTDVPPMIIGGRTLVPIRYVSESMGATVKWEEKLYGGNVLVAGPKSINIGGVTISTGETLEDITEKLGNPDRIDESVFDFKWHVYNKDYSKFVMIGINNTGNVCGFFSNRKGFSFNGINYGDINDKTVDGVKFYRDKYEDNRIYAVLVAPEASKDKLLQNESVRLDTEQEIFDFVNVFRLNAGLNILKPDYIAQKSSREKSQDMADKNYFDHNEPDGKLPWDRYAANNGVNFACGENIAAGMCTGIDAFDGWLNSEGHRKNMLSPTSDYLGVGVGFNNSSEYLFYYTQLFSMKIGK